MTTSTEEIALIKEQIDRRTALLQQLTDWIWVFMTIALIFFMQLGFVLLESGAARRKHSRTVLLKN